MDAVIDNHSGSGFGTSYGRGGNAVFSVIFSFKGKTAHGANAWAGRSALDAVEIMNVSTNFLREHLDPAYRMHYVILEGGEAPNVVPDKASVWYYVRNTDERVEEMYERVLNCAKAGALASGTELLPPAVDRRRPPDPHQQGRGRAHPEEHRARRHAGLDGGGDTLSPRPSRKNSSARENGMPDKVDALRAAERTTRSAAARPTSAT